MTYEVNTPILNSPYSQPGRYWFIREGEQSQLRDGRRPSIVYPPRDMPRNPATQLPEIWDTSDCVLQASRDFAPGLEMVLVNRIRGLV